MGSLIAAIAVGLIIGGIGREPWSVREKRIKSVAIGLMVIECILALVIINPATVGDWKDAPFGAFLGTLFGKALYAGLFFWISCGVSFELFPPRNGTDGIEPVTPVSSEVSLRGVQSVSADTSIPPKKLPEFLKRD